MGIRSLSTASISTGAKRSKFWDQSAMVEQGYESIATITVGSTSQSSITFSSIPSTYKHLELRAVARTSSATDGGNTVLVNLNGDTGSNYARHFIGAYTGASGGVDYTSSGNTAFMGAFVVASGNSTANSFGGGVIKIHDYASTVKNKTMHAVGGYDQGNASGYSYVLEASGLWRNTNAVTSITLTSGGNFVQYSHFALYGIKG